MIITPDLKQNIIITVYLTIVHNFVAFTYSMGILVSIFLALRKPSRATIFLLLGFILLLFGFEYQKHILDALKEQTINSLITIQEHHQVRRIVNGVLIKLIPFLLPFTGWCLVFLGGFFLKKGKKTK